MNGFRKKTCNFCSVAVRGLQLGAMDRDLSAGSENAIKIARVLGGMLKT